MDKHYKDLLKGNKIWVETQLKQDPNFFKKLANAHKPPLLWIGCSDSRVPANEITNRRAGEVFVHRNIANMVVHSDMNMLSVLEFAVQVLKVKHVIVCGHYGCGGIQAAMSNQQFGLIDNWLRNIKDTYRLHQSELDQIKDEKLRANRLTELNVVEQVYNLCKTSTKQNAWKARKYPHIHGWVYDVKSGIVNDLKVSLKNNDDLATIYRFDT